MSACSREESTGLSVAGEGDAVPAAAAARGRAGDARWASHRCHEAAFSACTFSCKWAFLDAKPAAQITPWRVLGTCKGRSWWWVQEGRCATAAAFRLRERLSKEFAASLGWAVTGSCVFGVAEPRQSRASMSHTHTPPHGPRCHSSLASPSPACPGVPCAPSGCLGAGGCFAWSRRVALRPHHTASTTDTGSGCQRRSHGVPTQTARDTRSAAVEGPWHVPGAAGCWRWLPAPSDSAQGSETTQGVR